MNVFGGITGVRRAVGVRSSSTMRDDGLVPRPNIAGDSRAVETAVERDVADPDDGGNWKTCGARPIGLARYGEFAKKLANGDGGRQADRAA